VSKSDTVRGMALKSRLVDALKACLRARGMTYAALATKLDLSEPTVKRMFSRGSFTHERIEQILEAIELDLQELARLARDGGPVKKTYGPRVMSEFLAARFKQSLEFLRFESRVMSPESAAVLKRRLERVVMDFNELAEVDSSVPSGRRIGVALLAACRPWEFSVVNALKRR